jgi:hypothetical protein
MNTRFECAQELREHGVPDELIGRVYNISRQRVHVLLGPRPPAPRCTPLPRIGAEVTPGDFKSFIKAFRARHSLSQAALADMLGVDQTTVARWENTGTCNLPGLVMLVLRYFDEGVTR